MGKEEKRGEQRRGRDSHHQADVLLIKLIGELILADVVDKYNGTIPGLLVDGVDSLWQAKPQIGFYCLYRKRVGMNIFFLDTFFI